jgi:hypothetical protein
MLKGGEHTRGNGGRIGIHGSSMCGQMTFKRDGSVSEVQEVYFPSIVVRVLPMRCLGASEKHAVARWELGY